MRFFAAVLALLTVSVSDAFSPFSAGVADSARFRPFVASWSADAAVPYSAGSMRPSQDAGGASLVPYNNKAGAGAGMNSMQRTALANPNSGGVSAVPYSAGFMTPQQQDAIQQMSSYKPGSAAVGGTALRQWNAYPYSGYSAVPFSAGTFRPWGQDYVDAAMAPPPASTINAYQKATPPDLKPLTVFSTTDAKSPQEMLASNGGTALRQWNAYPYSGYSAVPFSAGTFAPWGQDYMNAPPAAMTAAQQVGAKAPQQVKPLTVFSRSDPQSPQELMTSRGGTVFRQWPNSGGYSAVPFAAGSFNPWGLDYASTAAGFAMTPDQLAAATSMKRAQITEYYAGYLGVPESAGTMTPQDYTAASPETVYSVADKEYAPAQPAAPAAQPAQQQGQAAQLPSGDNNAGAPLPGQEVPVETANVSMVW